MPGASSCPKPKFITRKLAVEDDNMTPEDNCSSSTQEVVATSADIVDGANKDGTAAAAVAPATQQRQREGVTASLGRAQYQLNWCG